MLIRVFVVLLIVLSSTNLVNARITEHWTYEEMFNKADLVVIAHVISTRNTEERSTVLGLKVVGVSTELETRLVLKGSKEVKRFTLHHYRLQSETDENVVNGPDLVTVSKGSPRFLLFLVKEREGIYAPIGGQTDPAGLSVLELHGGAD